MLKKTLKYTRNNRLKKIDNSNKTSVSSKPDIRQCRAQELAVVHTVGAEGTIPQDTKTVAEIDNHTTEMLQGGTQEKETTIIQSIDFI